MYSRQMRSKTTLTILVAISTILALTSANVGLNKQEYSNLKRKFAPILLNNKDLIPRIVQFAFHDCVGGCDGCVNTDDPNNFNLKSVLKLAEDFRMMNAPRLSQADINVFISIQGLEFSARLARGRVSVPFSIGREDCDSSIGFPVRNFAHGRDLDSVQFLQRNFGTNLRESISLLGVHTLGRCHSEISGFDGLWDDTALALDNKYFQNLMQKGWFVEKRDLETLTGPLRSSQWSKNPNQHQSNMTMMLHADMIMYKNFTTSGPFNTPSCSYDDCPLSHTAGIVRLFSRSQRQFHRALSVAYRKMVDGDGRGLTRVS